MNIDEILFKTLCQNLRKILARKSIPFKVKRVTGILSQLVDWASTDHTFATTTNSLEVNAETRQFGVVYVDGALSAPALEALRAHMCAATVFHETTKVTFNAISDEAIQYYISNYKPYDKAGAYGIQEWIGAIAVSKIEGSYANVMGLPVDKVCLILS